MTKRSRYGNILLIDNDVLVYLFVYLPKVDEDAVVRVVQHLTLTFGRIWIPAYVRKEFLLKRKNQKRDKILRKVFKKYSNFSDCPIYVAEREVRFDVGMRDEDMGEADAFLQIQKAKSFSDCKFEEIVFLSNDQRALERAGEKQIKTFNYSKLKSTFLEIGIQLP